MDFNSGTLVYNAPEVFTAIAHGYYYVRPGIDTVNFIKRIYKILDKGRKAYSKIPDRSENDIQNDVYIVGKMTADALSVARSMFDEAYYSSQISRMVMHEEYDDSLLEYYMYWLNDEELESIFDGLVTFKLEYNAFISDENFDLMTDELEEKSIKVVQESSRYSSNYDLHMDCINNTTDFFFKYLSRRSIVDTICKYIDCDPLMFASLVKAFKYSDPRTAAEYTGLAMCLDYEFEFDIFNPEITDMSKVCLKDYKDAKAIYKNKEARVKIL